ncbi:multidrug efflux SMR transporter [uncultured Desulfovibrio sp.]|uniref:DMT family transporter n=1 Tax=uncultured Desulfovibrio sp. TaxID=167968 RepID=UPI0026112AB3|nr:multidrug efflux SMR transporter [uncultured Desulfovibrio sp.]
MNPWLTLVLAGLLEIGWPLGFKLAQASAWRVPGIIFAVISMALSGYLLFLAQRHIPLGTAYVVWTGMGAVGTFLIGVALFGDPLHPGRVLGVSLILGGVAVLKFSS